jgi:hypothetical protein
MADFLILLGVDGGVWFLMSEGPAMGNPEFGDLLLGPPSAWSGKLQGARARCRDRLW